MATSGWQRNIERLLREPQDKTDLLKAHATELTKLRDDLDLEICSYIEYCQTMYRWLRDLHKMVVSSFDKVKA
jgi:hypothetical protein